MNVLIPMAGAGSRFATAGYTFPKPLIEVNGKPMIQVVIENLNIEANYTFVVRKEHYEKYSLQYLLTLIAPGCNIVQVDELTEDLRVQHFLQNNILIMTLLSYLQIPINLWSGTVMSVCMHLMQMELMLEFLHLKQRTLNGLMQKLVRMGLFLSSREKTNQ